MSLVKLASTVPDLHVVNNWVAKADTARWNWPKEIAVVTGGANGIGLCKFVFSSKISLIASASVVVKGLIARGVKVAVLDVAPMDPSVQSGELIEHQCPTKLIDLDRSRLLPKMRYFKSRCSS